MTMNAIWSLEYLSGKPALLYRKHPASGAPDCLRGSLTASRNGDILSVTFANDAGAIAITERMIAEAEEQDGMVVIRDESL